MSKNSNGKNQHTIVLSLLDFLYLFVSLVLLHPSIYYDTATQTYTGGYVCTTIVYALGILYPIVSKFIKKEIEPDKFVRAADVASLAFGSLSLCSIMVYYALEVSNLWVWLAYIMAILTALPSFFSLIRAARKYIG